jgi:hypothetical protein
MEVGLRALEIRAAQDLSISMRDRRAMAAEIAAQVEKTPFVFLACRVRLEKAKLDSSIRSGR